MRFLNLSLILLFVSVSASCQYTYKSKAPSAVRAAFALKYPDEDNPDFEQDSHGYWEAHFKKDGEKYRADFHADGSWRETENSIKYKELPKAIRKAIEKEFGDRKIAEVEHVMSATKGEFFDVEFKQKGKNMDVEYRRDGTKL